jgi:hypothetical protein
VTPGSQAEHAGIKVGDVIEYFGVRSVTTPVNVMGALAQAPRAGYGLVALPVHDKAGSRRTTLYFGQFDVTGLIATPSLPSGFGPVTEADIGTP